MVCPIRQGDDKELRRFGHGIYVRNLFVIGIIARSATRRCLIYSEADFEVFRPAGATRCTDGGEIWRGGGDRRFPPPRHISYGPSSVPNFTPIGATTRV